MTETTIIDKENYTHINSMFCDYMYDSSLRNSHNVENAINHMVMVRRAHENLISAMYEFKTSYDDARDFFLVSLGRK